MQCVMDINPMSSLKVTYHSTCTCQPQPIPPLSWRPRGAVFPSPICLPRAYSLLAGHSLYMHFDPCLHCFWLARAGEPSLVPACLEAYCPPSLLPSFSLRLKLEVKKLFTRQDVRSKMVTACACCPQRKKVNLLNFSSRRMLNWNRYVQRIDCIDKVGSHVGISTSGTRWDTLHCRSIKLKKL